MPRGSLLGDDEELGKKNDDYRAGAEDLILSDLVQFKWPKWEARPGPRTQLRRRRIMTGGGALIAIIVILVLLLRDNDQPPPELRSRSRQPFQLNLENLELGAARRAKSELDPKPETGHLVDPNPDLDAPARSPLQQPAKGPPPEPAVRSGRQLQYYDGPVNFPALSTSLQGLYSGHRWRTHTGNVLFVAASPQSFARLVPMACEMDRWQRSKVHFAIMGRHEMKIEELERVNRVDKRCEITWIDARPDYPAYSSDERFTKAVKQALESIDTYVQPAVFIIDHPDKEDPALPSAMEGYSRTSSRPTISLPANAAQNLQWMTRLDPGSLGAWNKPSINILIQTPAGNGQSLIHLLKSLQNADYFGIKPPHLTIELPPDMEPRVEKFLDQFTWPPYNPYGKQYQSLLTLRRRLPQQRIGIVEASMRLIESFYPSSSHDSHVLLLSPAMELSPLYYHYLYYNLLEYKYADYNARSRESARLLGISIYSPIYQLNGKSKLARPTVPVDKNRRGEGKDGELTKPTAFLWQAPDTYATLYFGDKWKQLLFFFNERLRRTDLTDDRRVVTSAMPAFAEYFLELMRARGWFILYPHVPNHAFAATHKNRYQTPEEFADVASRSDADEGQSNVADPFYHPGPDAVPESKMEELVSLPLEVILPAEGDLAELAELPLLSYNGQKLTTVSAEQQQARFAQRFRETVGKCPKASKARDPTTDYSADDLFCDSKDAMKQLGTPFPEDDGFGTNGAGSNNALQGDFLGSIFDNNGDMIPPPISEDEKNSMQYEFSKHLERQKNRSG